MELKDEIERIAIAKPVAWKPSPSKFQSFSALLAADHYDDDDDHHAPPPPPPPVVTAAIRPKTVRLKLATSIVLNQDPTFMNNSFKVELPAPAPAPDLYSSSTSMNLIYKPLPRSVVTKNSASLSDNITSQPINMDDHHDPIDVKRIEASKIIEQNKSFPPWYDGYTWRKYGQKQVKGSEYPRSYYKCTHPSCPVKKMIERSLSGKIEEVVYKGEHNHPKPRPGKRGLGGFDQISGELEGKTSQIATFGLEDGNNEPKLIKKRKSELVFGESMGNDKVTSVETETTGDTFRWRKYGQKAVKGNSYPRSYYRCTNLKCSARKYVERSSDEPNALITTYEGKHNHDMPTSSKPKL